MFHILSKNFWRKTERNVLVFLSLFSLITIFTQQVHAELDPIPLEQTCINEGRPQGLSLVVDELRTAHFVYFTVNGQLKYLRLSEISGELTTDQLVIDLFDPDPAHTRMTLTDQGIAFCYYDPRTHSVMVIEQADDQLAISNALEAPSSTYCDIEYHDHRLFVSSVVNGQIRVAEGLDADPGQGVERVWNTTVVVELGASGYSAIQRSGDQLWVAASLGTNRLALASRSLNGGIWNVQEIEALTEQTLGDQLRLSARSGSFAGNIWATHTPPVSNRVISSDRGLYISELFNGIWYTENPLATYAGGYHDAFGGRPQNGAEGYLYIITREHSRSSIFGNTESLILVRYDAATADADRQVIAGPHGAGIVYTEMGLAPEPLDQAGQVIITAHFYEEGVGKLCRWSAPDQDHDALPDVDEARRGTRPDLADSDGDGIADGEEVLVRGTNPLIFDLPPARCDDEIRNGLETDTDCGGGECAPCEFGQTCEEDARDCAQEGLELVCLEGVCAQSSCEDGRQNQDESDIDCGGVHCALCVDGARCNRNLDCLEGDCVAGICFQADCNDGALNQDESDVDCGGIHCAPCSLGQRCEIAQDCEAAECILGICVAPSCEDGRQNQDESDVDCGGDSCDPCQLSNRCVSQRDCAVGECLAQRCAISSCEDGRQNQDESDIDCGGGTCAPCLDGSHCNVDQDCEQGQCLLNLCVVPSCQDGVQNIGESDIDCGGLICAPCTAQKRCISNTDCSSRRCITNDLGQFCAEATCEDGTQNGTETDVDCGGDECEVCQTNRVCFENRDCESGVCRGDRCQPPRCDDLLRNGDERDVDCGGSCLGCSAGKLCDFDADCISNHCLGGRCATATCTDQRLNQGEIGIDCGGPCLSCISIDMGSNIDMELDMELDVDSTLPTLDAQLWEDAEIDENLDEYLPFEDMSSDLGVDSELTQDYSPPLSIDAAHLFNDQSPISPDFEQEITDRSVTFLDPSNHDVMLDSGEMTQDIPRPAPINPEEPYDPSVFQKPRPKSGCDVTNRQVSSNSSLYLSLLLFIWYALSHSVFKRRSR